jgi:hypothetical protein
VIRLQAQFDHFSSAFHEGIKVLCLRMTARKTRDRRNVVTFLVALDDHSKFALGLHKVILSLRVGGFSGRPCSAPALAAVLKLRTHQSQSRSAQ